MSGCSDGLDGHGVARQTQAVMGMVKCWAAGRDCGYMVVHGSVLRMESGTVGDAEAENHEEDVARPTRGRPNKKLKKKLKACLSERKLPLVIR